MTNLCMESEDLSVLKGEILLEEYFYVLKVGSKVMCILIL